MNEDTLKLNLSPIATEPYNVFNDAPKVKYLTSDDLQRQVRISPDWIENVATKSTGAYKTPNRIADFGTSVAQGITQIPGRAVDVLAEIAGNFLLNPESTPVVTPIGAKTLGSFIPESLTEKLAGYRYPWEPIARRLMTDSFENLQQTDLANELYAMQKGIDPEQRQNELGRALGELWLYAGQIAATSAIGAPQIGIGLTMAEMTGDYAHETASQYVERTGDKDFENFTSDDAKLSSALAYGAIGTAIEFIGGVEPLLMGSLKRVGLRSSVGKASLKTGAEEGLEEFAQGMLEQFLRSSDGTGTQTWGEAFKESLKGAVYGAVIGGAIGGPAFYINRRNLVKGLRRAFPNATNANLTKIADTMIETAANQTHPDSRLIDNLKAKVRAMYADAEIVDDAIIDSTTNLEYSLISMDALERGIDIAEHPIFQGEVNELGWFREGIPEHRRTEINKYIADINDLTNKIQAENAKETKDWDKIDELETKLEFLRSQSLDRLEGLVIADRAELRKMLQEQQDELTRRRLLRLTQEQARKAAQRQDVLDERASERERRAEEKRIERQNKIELQKALREMRAEQRAQALKNRLMDVARIEAASDESLRAVLIEAGYLKDVVDKLKPRTLRSQVKQLQDANLDLLQSESTRLNQETLNLADENARLDDIYPAYTGDTINIDGKERTVYNSNGERIAQSEPALRNFYKWFGDSKVVDSQGRPLVVYHGTDAEFDTFDKWERGRNTQVSTHGFYFTDNTAVAETYGTQKMPVYLKFNRPYIIDYLGAFHTGILPEGTVAVALKDNYNAMLKGNYDVKVLPYQEAVKFIEENEEYTITNFPFWNTGEMSQFAQENGYDGVIFNNIRDAVGEGNIISNVFSAFEPNQIKSVNNRGTFSEDTGNVLFQGDTSGTGDKKRGAYIPEYRFIQKAATMDASTLSHELAHDWMQENFRWLRSGKASPEFKEMWGGVERALGIRENELRVPQKASEEFARAYEGWILNRKDWTKGLNVDGSDRDKMVEAFESYQAELRNIYDSLQNKYFKQTWGEYAQLKPEIESWFERQLNITDVDARERRGELTPAQANQERIDNSINQLIENGDKDIQGLKEIQTLNDTSRYEVPGGNKNSLQERLGILAKEIDENGMLVNPKYDTHRDMMKVAQDADTFVKTRQQDALDIINGIKPETDGLFASDLYTALERLAIENSDMNLFEELRTSEMANRIAKELGQRVAGFRQMKADGVDVMSAIKSLDRQYAKIAERNNAQIEEALELYEQAINNQDAKEMKNLDKFLSELECK